MNTAPRIVSDLLYSLTGDPTTIEIGKPFFDDETAGLFEHLLADARVYVEYGSGGTTLMAARQCELAISIESDRRFAAAVESKLQQEGLSAKGRIFHANIGPTGHWGVPILRFRGKALFGKRYSDRPWAELSQLNQSADLVLIDGRFRVASALRTALSLAGSTAKVLFDDFEKRPHYRAVLDFYDVAERAGRSVVLTRKAMFDGDLCRAALADFQRDYR